MDADTRDIRVVRRLYAASRTERSSRCALERVAQGLGTSAAEIHNRRNGNMISSLAVTLMPFEPLDIRLNLLRFASCARSSRLVRNADPNSDIVCVYVIRVCAYIRLVYK